MTLVYIDSDVYRTRYRVTDDRGWCEFETWPNRRVASHGGPLWPHNFPAVFTGWPTDTQVRADVALPERDPENTWGSFLERSIA